jgi:hypothetical protein
LKERVLEGELSIEQAAAALRDHYIPATVKRQGSGPDPICIPSAERTQTGRAGLRRHSRNAPSHRP